MKIIYKKDITPKIENLINIIGKRNFSVIIDNINGFFQGSNWSRSQIIKIDTSETPTYMYRVDSKTRLVFSKIKHNNEEKILLVDVLKKK